MSGGVDAVAGDIRMLRQNPLGGPVVHPVIGLAVGVVVPARELEKPADAFGVGGV
jgi:hypothetical protein